jgi:hypothetical protein
MNADGQTALATGLAERGLQLQSFDGNTLKLAYDSAGDHQIEEGKPVNEDELSEYARRLLATIPDTATMFPGLERIEVDFASL